MNSKYIQPILYLIAGIHITFGLVFVGSMVAYYAAMLEGTGSLGLEVLLKLVLPTLHHYLLAILLVTGGILLAFRKPWGWVVILTGILTNAWNMTFTLLLYIPILLQFRPFGNDWVYFPLVVLVELGSVIFLVRSASMEKIGVEPVHIRYAVVGISCLLVLYAVMNISTVSMVFGLF